MQFIILCLSFVKSNPIVIDQNAEDLRIEGHLQTANIQLQGDIPDYSQLYITLQAVNMVSTVYMGIVAL